jgi:hypothetical protein
VFSHHYVSVGSAEAEGIHPHGCGKAGIRDRYRPGDYAKVEIVEANIRIGRVEVA